MKQATRREDFEHGGLTPLSGAALVAALLLALAVGAVWFWLTTSVVLAGSPRLAVDRSEIDFGYRKYSTPVKAEFVLKNEGDGLLKLTPPDRAVAIKGC